MLELFAIARDPVLAIDTGVGAVPLNEPIGPVPVTVSITESVESRDRVLAPDSVTYVISSCERA